MFRVSFVGDMQFVFNVFSSPPSRWGESDTEKCDTGWWIGDCSESCFEECLVPDRQSVGTVSAER